jgi:hypothetical protein
MSDDGKGGGSQGERSGGDDSPLTPVIENPAYRFVNTQARGNKNVKDLKLLIPQPGPSGPHMPVVTPQPTEQTNNIKERVVHIYKEDNLRSWNLKYSGDSDVAEFLLRINDYMRSRDASEHKVLRCFSDLLSGRALDFYRQVRDSTSSLTDLLGKFKSFFTPIDSDYVLERTIRDHKQSTGQSLSMYVLEMQAMNSRLSVPLWEPSLIEIIKHNISPAYAHLLAVCDIDTLDRLIALGKRFEAYANPFPSESAMKPPRSHKQVTVVNTQHQKKRVIPETCRKCKKIGHNYKQCRTIPGIVCFGCGERGVLSSTCTKCRSDLQKPVQSSPVTSPKN